eukprot:TRINITY_DN40588_c0_g1_i1.p2 TRINITY_DN40588_c0_g1~~TRINITY_DN40588_c0_g1_i1.p2  ORF type:complete len:762 (+),score=128.68 TRINITY_DN40588_c0_g1_i1:2408-4693(+)
MSQSKVPTGVDGEASLASVDLTSRGVLSSQAGIARSDSSTRAHFIQSQWLPFIKELRDATLEALTRTCQESAPEKRMPPQSTVLSYLKRCKALTEQWYGPGSGNYSVVYSWFLRTIEQAKLTAYAYEELETVISTDGYVQVLDSGLRRQLYGSASSSTEALGADEALLAGNVSHKQGDSAIDNTVLHNVMSPRKATMLLAGGSVRQVLIKTMARRQQGYIEVLSQLEDEPLATSSPEAVKYVIKKWVESDGGLTLLQEKGVDLQSPSWANLSRTGRVVGDWSELSDDNRREIARRMAGEFTNGKEGEEGASTTRKASPRDGAKIGELFDFISWTKEHPGKIYKGDKKLHKKLLLLGMWSNEIAVLKRSHMESHTIHRYLPLEWNRICPLWTIDSKTDDVCVLRVQGKVEYSRIRSNHFPYQEAHGISVSSGGMVEGADQHGSLAYEFGSAMPTDEGNFKLPNWYASDIEKILEEVTLLNPCEGRAHLLPGEEYHEVGQNPKDSSSIGMTQHTHISNSTLAEWPLYHQEQNPMWVPEIGGSVDIVQVGSYFDSFFVKITTRKPNHPAIKSLLVDLRHALLSKFKRGIDFNVAAFPKADGYFSVIFTPLVMVERVPDAPYDRCNPDTGERASQFNLPCGSLDVSSGKGCLHILDPNQQEYAAQHGHEVMKSLYDFCRKQGARAVVRKFLLDRCAYCDYSGLIERVGARTTRRQQGVFTVLLSGTGQGTFGDHTSTAPTDKASVDAEKTPGSTGTAQDVVQSCV